MTLIFLEKTQITQKKTEAVLDASKKVDLEMNIEKTKYMLMTCCKKARKEHNTKIVNTSFERVARFKYMGTTLRGQNCMNEELKSRLNSGNSCYRSVQGLLSSCLLSRNVKVEI
jgi:hypothetical protein